jgi:uncharacterized membrane protein (UPF0127 family)
VIAGPTLCNNCLTQCFVLFNKISLNEVAVTDEKVAGVIFRLSSPGTGGMLFGVTNTSCHVFFVATSDLHIELLLLIFTLKK